MPYPIYRSPAFESWPPKESNYSLERAEYSLNHYLRVLSQYKDAPASVSFMEFKQALRFRKCAFKLSQSVYERMIKKFKAAPASVSYSDFRRVVSCKREALKVV